MAAITIDATTPSTTINLAVLQKLLERLLELSKRNSIVLGKDEFVLLNELRYAVTTGVGSTNTVSQIVLTYT
jgi:hypothetical protein